jgi:hypothetical protein
MHAAEGYFMRSSLARCHYPHGLQMSQGTPMLTMEDARQRFRSRQSEEAP